MKPRRRCIVTSKDNPRIGFIPRSPNCRYTVTGDFGEIDFDAPESYMEIGDPAYIYIECDKDKLE